MLEGPSKPVWARRLHRRAARQSRGRYRARQHRGRGQLQARDHQQWDSSRGPRASEKLVLLPNTLEAAMTFLGGGAL